MSQRHVLLYGCAGLLAQGIQDLLERQNEIVIHGPYPPTVDDKVHDEGLDLDAIVLVGEGAEDSTLLAHVLRQHPNLPVICVGLEEGEIRIYRSKQLTATTTNLLNAIAVRSSP